MSTRLNLHMHSEASRDCTLTMADYERMFANGTLGQTAITDHDEIDFALKAREKFGSDKIIVGEEVTTNKGKHVIGLFLKKFIPRGLPAARVAQLIRAQRGLVYLPHPTEPTYGVGEEVIRELASQKMLDILETHNSRNWLSPKAFFLRHDFNLSAQKLAEELNIPQASSSDSHIITNSATTYMEVSEPATLENLLDLLIDPRTKHIKGKSKLHPDLFAGVIKETRLGVKLPFLRR